MHMDPIMPSQIGEFSFVLAAIGLQAKAISQYTCHITLTVIALSLLLSPLWIMAAKHAVGANLPMSNMKRNT